MARVQGKKKFTIHRPTSRTGQGVIADYVEICEGGVLNFYNGVAGPALEMVLLYKLRDGESVTWEERK